LRVPTVCIVDLFLQDILLKKRITENDII